MCRYFENKEFKGWRLIDFGFGRRIGGNYCVCVDDNQYKRAGTRIRTKRTGGEVTHWTIADDYEMLVDLTL